MQNDEDFMKYWAENREKQKTSIRPLLVGMSSGFVIGVLILITLSSGWYQRAEMVANASFSSVIFILAILLLSCFMAFFYRKFRWEMQEQRYQELMAKKKREGSSH
jgi:nitrate reductase gamma subunit